MHRAGGNTVHPDFFRAEIVSKIARAGFKAGFGNAHHVVMRYDFLGPVIGHRDDAAAIGHQRRRFARERDQRIRADILRDAEGFACRADKIAFQRFPRRIRQGVQHQIDAIGLAPNVLEKCFDLVVA